jgi:signal transduction histidine kinase
VALLAVLGWYALGSGGRDGWGWLAHQQVGDLMFAGVPLLALLAVAPRGLPTAAPPPGTPAPAAVGVACSSAAGAGAAHSAAAAEERRRLCRDLHDGVQQRLLATAMRLSGATAPTADPAETAAIIERARLELLDVNREIRKLARGASPAAARGGLGPALHLVAADLALPATCRVADPRLRPDRERALFLVLREAMTNAAKHARAGRVRVAVRTEGDTVVGEVADDGVGGARVEPGGGLDGAAERLAPLGGAVRVRSAAGAGTTVTVRLPCG